MRLAQGEVFYPSFQEGRTSPSAVACAVKRLPDAYYLDWNDSTFKNSGWTTQWQVLSKDSIGNWSYTTGWTVASANSTYQVVYKFTVAGTDYYQLGDPIIVHSSYLDVLADLVNGGRLDLLIDAVKAKTDNLPADPADDSDIDAQLATLAARLTAARAGYLDNLSGGAVALASVCTEARLAELAAANLPADVDAIKAKTDLQPAGIPKNVALSGFTFLMTDNSDHITGKTGLTVTAQISKDGGAFVTCINSVTEIAYGLYKINLTQAEMNADVLTLRFSAPGADDRIITIKTSA